MSKQVTIPSNMNPWWCNINGAVYSYTAGSTQTVPDEVAAVIENYNNMLPKLGKNIPDWGLTTLIDKTQTKDEAVSTGVKQINIPEQNQKKITDLRISFYTDTPASGAVYSDSALELSANENCTLGKVANFYPTKASKNFTATGYDTVSLDSSLEYDGVPASVIAIKKFKDANGAYDGGVPADAQAPITAGSTVTADLGSGTEHPINAVTTKTHTIGTYTVKTYAYSASTLYDTAFLEVVIESNFDGLPVGTLYNASYSGSTYCFCGSFATGESISYKNLAIVNVAVSDTKYSTDITTGKQNKITSFDEPFVAQKTGTCYIGQFADGIVKAVTLNVPSSTVTGTPAKKIYKGSRLIVQVRYEE